MQLISVVPNSPADFTDKTPQLYREGYDYYRTPRGQHPGSPGKYMYSSLPHQIAFFPFDQLDTISPRPLLVIAGSRADTLFWSRDVIKKAKDPKELHIIEGATHIDTYDRPTICDARGCEADGLLRMRTELTLILKRRLRVMGKRFLKSGQAGVLIGAALLCLAVMGGGKAAPPPVVRVDSGELQGVVDDGVESYKGIPFAAAPVGDLRWRPPEPMAHWTSVRQAAEFGADCMRGRFGPPPSPGAPPAPPPSEDCLFLNVWKSASAGPGAKLPVMVWIYGGGFVGGSSSSPITSGTQFAKKGIVLVAANYRVGRFGFFAFPALSRERPDETKGHYAYMDQIAALQWAKRNIAAFGGDPNNLTIFGFSADGVSVHSLLASPMARGLFQKAIAESGGSRDSVLTARPMSSDGVDPNYPVSAETIGIQFARSIGIEGTDRDALAKLRALSSAEEVLRDAPAQPGVRPPSYETTPILDGKLITETAETAYKAKRQPRVPLMVGSNSADTAGNRIRATTKEQLWAGTDAERGSARVPEASARQSPATAQDQAVSRMAQSYWVNFVKTGDPNGAGLPVWPRHDPGKDLIFEFRPDGSASAGPDSRKARLDVMQLATDSGKRADF